MSKAISSVGGAVSSVGSSLGSSIGGNTFGGFLGGLGGAAGGYQYGNLFGGPVGGALGIQQHFQGQADAAKQKALSNIPQIAKPTYPGFQSLLQDGQLPEQFQLGQNTQALEALREQGLSEGVSAGGQRQLDFLDQQRNNEIGNLGQFAQSAKEQASRQVGGTTGLREGTKSRFADLAQRQTQLGNQGINRAAALQKNAILSGDAQQQLASLQALPGAELNALKPQEFNIRNLLGEKQAGDAADLSRFSSEMQAYAGGNTSSAIANSGKK